MKTNINLALVDDHSLMREGLSRILQMQSSLKVTKKVANGVEMMQGIENDNVDVVLLDINMPDMNGIETLKRIKISRPDMKVIMLTVHDNREYLMESLNLGANGYMLKDAESDDLIKAIEMVYDGGSYIHPSLAGELFKEINRQRTKKSGSSNQDVLTKREHEVLLLIADGYSNRGISDKLVISEKTVKNHVSSILKKLDLQDRTQAAIYAIKTNLTH